VPLQTGTRAVISCPHRSAPGLVFNTDIQLRRTEPRRSLHQRPHALGQDCQVLLCGNVCIQPQMEDGGEGAAGRDSHQLRHVQQAEAQRAHVAVTQLQAPVEQVKGGANQRGVSTTAYTGPALAGGRGRIATTEATKKGGCCHAAPSLAMQEVFQVWTWHVHMGH
jgi:hypothetical protein